MSPETLALIPARGGSKGVPRKNLREVAGRSLLARAVETALSARTVGRVVVSTEDDEIAAAARAAGAEVPFRRPAELAGDDTPDLPVLRHALDALAAEGYEPWAVAWLRPTAPLLLPEDVDAAVELLRRTGADAVRSIAAAEHHPYWLRRLEGDRLVPFLHDVDAGSFLRRQSLPPAYRPNGAVDVVAVASVPADGAAFDGGDVRGYPMPPERSVDVDSELHLRLVELLLAERERRP